MVWGDFQFCLKMQPWHNRQQSPAMVKGATWLTRLCILQFFILCAHSSFAWKWNLDSMSSCPLHCCTGLHSFIEKIYPWYHDSCLSLLELCKEGETWLTSHGGGPIEVKPTRLHIQTYWNGSNINRNRGFPLNANCEWKNALEPIGLHVSPAKRLSMNQGRLKRNTKKWNWKHMLHI